MQVIYFSIKFLVLQDIWQSVKPFAGLWKMGTDTIIIIFSVCPHFDFRTIFLLRF